MDDPADFGGVLKIQLDFGRGPSTIHYSLGAIDSDPAQIHEAWLHQEDKTQPLDITGEIGSVELDTIRERIRALRELAKE